MAKEPSAADNIRNAPAPADPNPLNPLDIQHHDEHDNTGNLPDGGGVVNRDGDGKVKSEPNDAPEDSVSDIIDAEQDREQKGSEHPTLTGPQDHTTARVEPAPGITPRAYHSGE